MPSSVVADLIANDKVTAAVNKAASGLKQYADKARGALAGVADQFSKLGDRVAGFGKSLMGTIPGLNATTLGIAGMTAALAKSYQASETQRLAEAKLAAVLKATGGAAGLSAEEIKKFASARQALTNFGDEATIAVSGVLASFKNIKGDVFKDTLVAIQDVASVMGTDMQSAATQLGKAINDPIQGLTMLTRVGITFTEQQKDQIKTLQESGKLMDAQKLILDELKSKFGGAAEAMVTPVQQMKNAIGDLMENIGSAIAPAINALAKGLKGLAEILQYLTGGWFKHAAGVAAFALAITGILTVIVKAISMFKALIVTLRAYASAQAIAQALSGPAGWATLAIGAAIAVASVAALSGAFDKMEASAKGAADAAAKVPRSAGQSIPGLAGPKSRELTRTRSERGRLGEELAGIYESHRPGGDRSKETALSVQEQEQVATLSERINRLDAESVGLAKEATVEARQLAIARAAELDRIRLQLGVEAQINQFQQSQLSAMERVRQAVGDYDEIEITRRRVAAEQANAALGGRTQKEAPEEYAAVQKLTAAWLQARDARYRYLMLTQQDPATLAGMKREAIKKEVGIDTTDWKTRYEEAMAPVRELFKENTPEFRAAQQKIADSFGIVYGPMENYKRAMQAIQDKLKSHIMTAEAAADATRKLNESFMGPMLSQSLQGKLNEKFANIERDFQQRFGRNLSPSQAAAERDARRKAAVSEATGLPKTPQEQFDEAMKRAAVARGDKNLAGAAQIERDANRQRMESIREQARQQSGLGGPFENLLTNSERLKGELDAIKRSYQAGGYGTKETAGATETMRRQVAAAMEQYGKQAPEVMQPRFEGLQDTWRRIQESAAGRSNDPQERAARAAEANKDQLAAIGSNTKEFVDWLKKLYEKKDDKTARAG